MIGVAVLVALGIIVWPIVFDSSPVREISQRSQIPPAPAVERFSIDEPRRPDLPAEPDEVALEPQPSDGGAADPGLEGTSAQAGATPAQATADRPKAIPEVEHDAYGLPLQWAVQLGVFSRIEGAQQSQQKAESQGFRVVMQTITGKEGAQYRVLVGPKLDRDAAEQLRRDIQRKLGVNGYVTRFAP
jgi:DedD protein